MAKVQINLAGATVDVGENGQQANPVESTQDTVRPRIEPYSRQAANWIATYLEYTKESESPETYHLWAALSAVAAAVRRNVWLDQGLYVLYPNLYVAFVGPPARTAKSTALYLARTIMNQVQAIKMGPEACSKEELIRQMAESKYDNQCAMTIHSSELSDFLDTSGVLMIQFLTSIYDGNYAPPKGWNYATKHQGKDFIVNPFLNVIFGTTPSYLAESMPDNIVGHGFASRTIVVYEEKERHENSLPDNMDPTLAKALVEDLRHISHLRGQFTWGGDLTDETSRTGRRLTEAEATYDRFYKSLYKGVPADHRIEGFHWRKKTHVLKIAMLLSLAERDDLTIQSHDIEAAVQFLHDLEPQMARAFSAVGKFEHATTLERIGNQIRAAGAQGGMSIEEVYRRNYFAGDDYTLERLISTLKKGGMAIEKRLENGKVVLLPTKGALPWAVRPAKVEESLLEPGPVRVVPQNPDPTSPSTS
jgi:hypothetical protein